MEANENQNQDAYSMEHFKNQMTAFSKAHAIAKDFVKFLNTLDRQFKNISKGDLT